MKNTYVFILSDEGLVKEVITGPDLIHLADKVKSSLRGYLNENGYKYDDMDDIEFKTEDGFACIYLSNGQTLAIGEHIWSYHFDGEETVEAAIDQLLNK